MAGVMDGELARFADALPGFVWTALPDGRVDFVNNRWRGYTGLDQRKPSRSDWQSVVHPEDLAVLIARWRALVASGEPGEMEARMRRGDGVYRWFSIAVNPLRDEAGRIVGWCGLNTDIELHRQVERAAPASAYDSHAIIDAMPTMAWCTGPDGYCELLNQRWLDYAGVTLEEVQGWGWEMVIHPEDFPSLKAHWQASLTSGLPDTHEARIRRFDGVYRWFLFLANPLRDKSGKIVKWFGANVDIEDRKRADQALQARERNLTEVINAIPNTAWSTLPDGYCDFLNSRWLDYAGMTAEEARGWAWSACIHPDDLEGLVGYWQACLATGKPVDTEARMRRHDGVYRWFLFRANPLRDESGTIVKWFGTNVDIEDRKRADEELRRSEVLLAEGQRVSQTGSFYWRLDTDEIRCSDELYRILALEPRSAVTLRDVAARVHPDDLPILNEKIAHARTGGTEFDYEMRLCMPDGASRYVRMTASRTRTGDRDRDLEYVGAIQDLTDRRRSEEALAKVQSELAYMTRVASMGALTASIAHEVNQPLSGILTNASACSRMLSADPPNVAGALETVRRTIRDGNRATDVITRLYALFAKKNTATELLDLNEATREVIALSMNELQRNRVTLRAELGGDLPPLVGDRIQLQQVILNLLMNASAAMAGVDDRPRQVTVRTERDGPDFVRLSIQDAGVGITAEDSERLFEAFYTTKTTGLGIGLSVSRSIIENHHGRLWAAPNEGPGATFTFSIPCRIDQRETA